jgi:hypothetical protein
VRNSGGRNRSTNSVPGIRIGQVSASISHSWCPPEGPIG